MSHAYRPPGGDWVEISPAGTRLAGAGEAGEDVIVSDAFVASLPAETQAERGFVEVAETPQPEGETVIGWTVVDVDGSPTRQWVTAD